MQNMKHIQDFLRRHGIEGPQQTRAYIPCKKLSGCSVNFTGGNARVDDLDPFGVSGVTIATGVDLGQTDYVTLKRIGVQESICNMLAPFLGKKDKDAVVVLNRLGGLTVSQAVADELDYCMHYDHYKRISTRYDKDAGMGAFDNIPKQAQAVIFSILYQRGPGYVSKMPKTWGFLVKKEWCAAAHELQTGFKEYADRRKLEGIYLAEIC